MPDLAPWEGKAGTWIRVAGIGLIALAALLAAPHLAVLSAGVAILLVPRIVGLRRFERLLPLSAAALAVAGLVAAALRWGTADLAAISGAQGVLGPAVVVGPSRAAAATVLGASAFVLGLSVGLRVRLTREWLPLGVGIGELLATGLALALLAWGPAGQEGEMWLAALAAAVVIGAFSWAAPKLSPLSLRIVVGLGALSAAIALWMGRMAA